MGLPGKGREEADIVRRALNGEAVKQLAPVTAREDIIEMERKSRAITVRDDIMDYAVEIARNNGKADISPSAPAPGPIALVRAARSRAYLEAAASLRLRTLPPWHSRCCSIA